MELQRQKAVEPLAPAESAPAALALRSSAADDSGLSFRSLLEACFRHRTRFLLVAGAVLLATLAAILLTPKRYQASMQMVVLNARHYAAVSSTVDPQMPSPGLVTDNDVNSQAELMHSHDVLSGALDEMGYATATPLARDKVMEDVNRHLDVAPVRQSDVLNVTYTDRSPDAARSTLQAIANSFVAKELVLLRPTAGHQVFDSLVIDAEAKLAAAQERFSNFKVAHGIASLQQDETGLVQQLRDAGTQADALNSELRAEQQRRDTAQSELGKHPDRILTQDKSVPNQQAIQELSAKLVELQNKRTALLTGYLPGDRFVQEVDAQIRTTQEALDGLRKDGSAEQTTDVNPLHQELTADLARSSITAEALVAKRRAVAAARQSYLSRLNQLEVQGTQYQALEHAVSEAQQNYDLAVKKRDQASVDDALDRDRIMNVAFAAKPSAELLPVQPKPRLYLALGLFVAIFFGLASCALAEMGRQTVYTPAELDMLTGVMTLAVLPLKETRSDREQVQPAAAERSPQSRKEGASTDARSVPLEPYLARSTKQ